MTKAATPNSITAPDAPQTNVLRFPTKRKRAHKNPNRRSLGDLPEGVVALRPPPKPEPRHTDPRGALMYAMLKEMKPTRLARVAECLREQHRLDPEDKGLTAAYLLATDICLRPR
jgi:hypothetical protein